MYMYQLDSSVLILVMIDVMILFTPRPDPNNNAIIRVREIGIVALSSRDCDH